jgi:tetratricopeptide (TPR) repeat protein
VALEVEGSTSAFKYQSEALQFARLGKNRALEANILENLANAVGLSQGDFHAARDYFEQAMLIFNEYGEVASKGHVCANLGWVSGMLGDYQAAIKYYDQALIISRQMGNRMEEMFTYVNLSTTAYAQNQAGDALKWAQLAIDLSAKIGGAIGEAWAYYCLGLAQLSAQHYAQAVDSLMKSLEIRTSLNAAPLIVEARAGLVDAYWRLADQASAKKEAELLIEYMVKDNSFEGAEEPLRIYLALFEHLGKLKDPRAALVLRNAKQLLDTQVSKLRSDEARIKFVENVPWRRAIARAAMEYQM